MSRETNTLLLRYGLNTFWSKYLSLPKFSYLNLQFNSFFKLFLQNYFLIPIKIEYFLDLILLYVFSFNEDRYSFIYKFLKFKKLTIKKLSYRKFIGFNLKKNYTQLVSQILTNTISFSQGPRSATIYR